MEEEQRVCVTGAGGYVASWLVKLLLAEGHIVNGTVRDPCLSDAISGCNVVFHVASPVRYGFMPNPEEEVIEPAVTGTKNALDASLKSKVQKVVVVSSIGAVIANPNWPKDRAMDKNCWSDKDHCKATGEWYYLSKTLAEEKALQYAERSELKIVTMCLSVMVGPMLQPTVNASSLLLKDAPCSNYSLLFYYKSRLELRIWNHRADDDSLNLLWESSSGTRSSVENRDRSIVGVRDVAEAAAYKSRS